MQQGETLGQGGALRAGVECEGHKHAAARSGLLCVSVGALGWRVTHPLSLNCHSHTPSSVHPFTHPHTHSLILSTLSSSPTPTDLETDRLTHSLTYTPTNLLTYSSYTYLFIHPDSPTYPLIH